MRVQDGETKDMGRGVQEKFENRGRLKEHAV
jgi:hypothetical protein